MCARVFPLTMDNAHNSSTALKQRARPVMSVAACYSMLQRVAEYYGVLQCVAVCCSALQCGVVSCCVSRDDGSNEKKGWTCQHACCSVLQRVAVCEVCCSALLRVVLCV